MRNRILALLAVVLLHTPLAWAQTAQPLPTLPQGLTPQLGIDLQDPEKVAPPQNKKEEAKEHKEKEKEHEEEEHEHEEEEEHEEAKHPDRLWLRMEYLLWFIRNGNVPALATTGSINDASPGALGNPSTRVLSGGDGIDYFNRSGGRFTGDYWFDDDHHFGLEAGYFFIAANSVGDVIAYSPGLPVLARPFFNTNTGKQDSSLIGYPGVVNGSIAASTGSFLQGAELNLTTMAIQTEHFRLQGLFGFRYANLNEGLQISEFDSVAVAAQYAGFPIPYAGNTINVSDSFDTRNNFYGAQFGGKMEFHWKRLTLELLGKVALGGATEAVTIKGFTAINTTPETLANAGLLATASNSGVFTKDAFCVIPEVGLNLGFELTNHIRIFGGYTFLYWSNVLRPGDQVDASVNPNLVPTSTTYGTPGGAARPAFTFHSNDFFAQGANVGVEVRY